MAQMLCLEEWFPCLGPQASEALSRNRAEAQGRPQHYLPTTRALLCSWPWVWEVCKPRCPGLPWGWLPKVLGVQSLLRLGTALTKCLSPQLHTVLILDPRKLFGGPDIGLHYVRTGVFPGLWRHRNEAPECSLCSQKQDQRG